MVRQFDLARSAAPFTRCLIGNGRLAAVPKEEILDRLRARNPAPLRRLPHLFVLPRGLPGGGRTPDAFERSSRRPCALGGLAADKGPSPAPGADHGARHGVVWVPSQPSAGRVSI
ncbi:MAG: hypothetical protein ACHQJD_00430 [Thermoanaerobaculia bacterium]